MFKINTAILCSSLEELYFIINEMKNCGITWRNGTAIRSDKCDLISAEKYVEKGGVYLYINPNGLSFSSISYPPSMCHETYKTMTAKYVINGVEDIKNEMDISFLYG